MARNRPAGRRPKTATAHPSRQDQHHGPGHSPSGPQSVASFHDRVMGQMDPKLKAELDGLRRHESRILAGLKQPATARLFATDPRAALVKMKVPLSPQMRAQLKGARPPQDLLEPKGYRLPTGQVVVPTVTVRFTKQEDVAHDG